MHKVNITKVLKSNYATYVTFPHSSYLKQLIVYYHYLKCKPREICHLIQDNGAFYLSACSQRLLSLSSHCYIHIIVCRDALIAVFLADSVILKVSPADLDLSRTQV